MQGPPAPLDRRPPLVVFAAIAAIAAVAAAIAVFARPFASSSPPPARPTAAAETATVQDPGTPVASPVPGGSDRVAAPRDPIDDTGPGLHVVVLDSNSDPVRGVEVELSGRLAGEGSSGNRFARSTTDSRGRAFLVAEARQLRQLEALGVALDFEVAADVPLPEPPVATLGEVPHRREPVVLQLPPSGSAAVRVVDRDGAPVDDGGRVYMFWRTEDSDGRWERTGIPSADSAGGGTARFAIVPLDRELLFRATGGDRYAYGEVTTLGPTRAGESVGATIRLGRELPFVVGRLVDETGTAIADTEISIGVGSVPADAPLETLPERSQLSYTWAVTDHTGSFRKRVSTPLRADRRRVLAFEQDDSRSPNGGEVVRRALVPLQFALPDGADTDLGTIVALPDGIERLLVAGIVVDQDGAPIAHADVSAGFRDPQARAWTPLHRTRVRSGRDGRFEIRTAAEPPPEFTVSAGASKHVGASRSATPGARDVELALRRAGTLTAWVRAPEGVPPTLLVGRIGDREPNQFAGRFGADDLLPGPHEVTVRIRDTGWVVARVEGVLVPEGGAADDPRLGGIAAACRPLKLRLLDAGGEPLRNARLWLEDPSGRGGSLKTDADGRVLTAVPLSLDLLVVRSPEFGHAEIVWRPDEQTVRLTPR